jgi:diguanylate cyclase (GGDEF)-like protein
MTPNDLSKEDLESAGLDAPSDLPEKAEMLDALKEAEGLAAEAADSAVREFVQLKQRETGVEIKSHIEDDLRQAAIRSVLYFLYQTSGESEKLDAPEFLTSSAKAVAMLGVSSRYKLLDIYRQINVDPGTGLPNKRAYEKVQRRVVKANIRNGETYSEVAADVDKFKAVNDTHGHDAGDQVLKEIARRVTKEVHFREGDIFARVGGEEFAVILPGAPAKGAAIVAQRISDVISSRPFAVTVNNNEKIELPVTLSIGIAEYRGWEEDPTGKGVKQDADSSLYVLKGQKADADGHSEPRRGGICLGFKVLSRDEIESYRSEFPADPKKRSSFPPAHEPGSSKRPRKP